MAGHSVADSSRIRPRPTTKGGVMIGRMVSSRSPFLKGKAVRVATSAKASPSAVEALAGVEIAAPEAEFCPRLSIPVRVVRADGRPVRREVEAFVGMPEAIEKMSAFKR